MKAVVLTRYGDASALQIREVAQPQPGPGEMLVRVRATTVTRGDTELRALDMPWLFRLPIRLWLGLWGPRKDTVLGMEFSGVVERLGDGVDDFAVGDAVFGTSEMGLGTYGEYVCVRADGMVAKKPEAVSFSEAAAVPIGGLAALGYLRRGGIERAKRVLIRGATGSIGSFAVQIARHFGAHVTAVCPPEGVQRARELGADEVLDHTERDFDAVAETWDLMLDVVGRTPISRGLSVLTEGGVYVLATIPDLFALLRSLWVRLTSTERLVLGDSGDTPQRLRELAELLESDQVRPVLDRVYALEEVVEAHRYVERGHKQGNVVLVVEADEVHPRSSRESAQ